MTQRLIIILLITLCAIVLSFIYWLLNTRQREWVRDYLLPILFFLGLGGKTAWRAIRLLNNRAAKRYLLILLSMNNLFILSFMALTITSYIIRNRPTHKAIGIKERAFPLFVLFFQFTSAYLIAMHTRFNFNLTRYISGIILSILGSIIGCLALWELKRSFSIMVEVRQLITKGIYSKIRHPLYAGELLSLLGIALLFNNIAGYTMFALLLLMQCARAILEERKLIAHFPEYTTYRENTGFFLPRLIKKSTSY